eukprot:TRINITY_DN7508_c0_g1_i1.p1 TRINITY_DN7508_c0_g1~~TRINITY_DN7508_c0_g1_i1.p1  ORF type:complete len:712 (-),score=186.85 TRINITY_DN7508_c0_g1_i1:28-2163(-)
MASLLRRKLSSKMLDASAVALPRKNSSRSSRRSSISSTEVSPPPESEPNSDLRAAKDEIARLNSVVFGLEEQVSDAVETVKAATVLKEVNRLLVDTTTLEDVDAANPEDRISMLEGLLKAEREVRVQMENFLQKHRFDASEREKDWQRRLQQTTEQHRTVVLQLRNEIEMIQARERNTVQEMKQSLTDQIARFQYDHIGHRKELDDRAFAQKIALDREYAHKIATLSEELSTLRLAHDKLKDESSKREKALAEQIQLLLKMWENLDHPNKPDLDMTSALTDITTSAISAAAAASAASAADQQQLLLTHSSSGSGGSGSVMSPTSAASDAYAMSRVLSPKRPDPHLTMSSQQQIVISPAMKILSEAEVQDAARMLRQQANFGALEDAYKTAALSPRASNMSLLEEQDAYQHQQLQQLRAQQLLLQQQFAHYQAAQEAEALTVSTPSRGVHFSAAPVDTLHVVNPLHEQLRHRPVPVAKLIHVPTAVSAATPATPLASPATPAATLDRPISPWLSSEKRMSASASAEQDDSRSRSSSTMAEVLQRFNRRTPIPPSANPMDTFRTIAFQPILQRLRQGDFFTKFYAQTRFGWNKPSCKFMWLSMDQDEWSVCYQACEVGQKPYPLVAEQQISLECVLDIERGRASAVFKSQKQPQQHPVIEAAEANMSFSIAYYNGRETKTLDVHALAQQSYNDWVALFSVLMDAHRAGRQITQ